MTRCQVDSSVTDRILTLSGPQSYRHHITPDDPSIGRLVYTELRYAFAKDDVPAIQSALRSLRCRVGAVEADSDFAANGATALLLRITFGRESRFSENDSKWAFETLRQLMIGPGSGFIEIIVSCGLVDACVAGLANEITTGAALELLAIASHVNKECANEILRRVNVIGGILETTSNISSADPAKRQIAERGLALIESLSAFVDPAAVSQWVCVVKKLTECDCQRAVVFNVARNICNDRDTARILCNYSGLMVNLGLAMTEKDGEEETTIAALDFVARILTELPCDEDSGFNREATFRKVGEKLFSSNNSISRMAAKCLRISASRRALGRWELDADFVGYLCRRTPETDFETKSEIVSAVAEAALSASGSEVMGMISTGCGHILAHGLVFDEYIVTLVLKAIIVFLRAQKLYGTEIFTRQLEEHEYEEFLLRIARNELVIDHELDELVRTFIEELG